MLHFAVHADAGHGYRSFHTSGSFENDTKIVREGNAGMYKGARDYGQVGIPVITMIEVRLASHP